MKLFRMLVKLLVIIGALNWGLIAFFHYDAVADLFGGPMMMGTRVAYGIVGIAGVFALICFIGRCCGCGKGSCGCGPNCSCKGGNGGPGGGCGCPRP